jgi:hypothetical protein
MTITQIALTVLQFFFFSHMLRRAESSCFECCFLLDFGAVVVRLSTVDVTRPGRCSSHVEVGWVASIRGMKGVYCKCYVLFDIVAVRRLGILASIGSV